jgi:hypothetical protein
VPRDKYDSAVNSLAQTETKLKETEARLESTAKELETTKKSERQFRAIVDSPEYKFWEMCVGTHAPRERLKLLHDFGKGHPTGELGTLANQAFILTANGMGDTANDLLNQQKFEEALALITGVSEGLPELADFEKGWLEKIRGLADYNVRKTARESFQKEFKAGRISVGEIISKVKGKAPYEVIEILGPPSRTATRRFGQEFTYWDVAPNQYTGKSEDLVISFADSPINKVLSVKAASGSAYVDEKVSREVGEYLSGR